MEEFLLEASLLFTVSLFLLYLFKKSKDKRYSDFYGKLVNFKPENHDNGLKGMSINICDNVKQKLSLAKSFNKQLIDSVSVENKELVVEINCLLAECLKEVEGISHSYQNANLQVEIKNSESKQIKERFVPLKKINKIPNKTKLIDLNIH